MYASTAQSKKNLSIGAQVFVRDSSNRSWMCGTVSTVDPVTVQVEGWPIPMSFKFVVSKKPNSDKAMPVAKEKEECIIVNNSSIGQVIGACGNVINRIRRTTRAKVTIYDRNSYALNSLPSLHHESVSKGYWCVVKVVGSERRIEKARTLMRNAQDVPVKWNMRKYARKTQARRQQRHKNKGRRKLRGCDMTEEMWLLQKEQHGANGSWHTRKFKNKGKKHRGPSHGSWKWKTTPCRKPNRKQTFMVANRRVSF